MLHARHLQRYLYRGLSENYRGSLDRRGMLDTRYGSSSVGSQRLRSCKQDSATSFCKQQLNLLNGDRIYV